MLGIHLRELLVLIDVDDVWRENNYYIIVIVRINIIVVGLDKGTSHHNENDYTNDKNNDRST